MSEGQQLEKREKLFRKALAERDRRVRQMVRNQATVEGKERRAKQQRIDRERIAEIEREAVDIADDYGPRQAAERRRNERRQRRG